MLSKKKFSSNAISSALQSSGNDLGPPDSKSQFLSNMPSHPQVAPAAAQAIQAGANPGILDKAKADLGSQGFIGLCERFVEATQGTIGKYASAIADWNANKNNAVSLDNAKPGDKIFYAPDASNSGYGHVGVVTGNGKMISAQNNGVKETSIKDWVKNTGQSILGVIPS